MWLLQVVFDNLGMTSPVYFYCIHIRDYASIIFIFIDSFVQIRMALKEHLSSFVNYYDHKLIILSPEIGCCQKAKQNLKSRGLEVEGFWTM